MYLFTPNYPKLKTHLRLAEIKLKLLQRKQSELIQKTRKEIAELISIGKIQKAKFKVEQIISEDEYVEALEIVEMYCNLLLAKFSLILNTKELEDCLTEAVSSLIWVAPRLTHEIHELKVISNILRSKYGNMYAEICNRESESLKDKFSAPAPSKLLIEKYMTQIAKNYNVPYEPDPEIINNNSRDPKPTGNETYTQTPLVHFLMKTFNSQTSDLNDDYEEEISLEIPDQLQPLALKCKKTMQVESFEMPEFPFDLNDIIYDVPDLQPASDEADLLRIARNKRYDLPFSPLQPRPLDSCEMKHQRHKNSGYRNVDVRKTNKDVKQESLDRNVKGSGKENRFPELPVVLDEDGYVLPKFPSIPDLEDVREKPNDVNFDELCSRFNKLKKK